MFKKTQIENYESTIEIDSIKFAIETNNISSHVFISLEQGDKKTGFPIPKDNLNEFCDFIKNFQNGIEKETQKIDL